MLFVIPNQGDGAHTGIGTGNPGSVSVYPERRKSYTRSQIHFCFFFRKLESFHFKAVVLNFPLQNFGVLIRRQ